jgi:transposase-like protein
METRVEQASSQRRRKYSPEFKQAAVRRFLAGESATAIARELEIRRKFLYAWRDEGFGANAVPSRDTAGEGDPRQRQIAQQQQKIAELERLTGQQASQLDFFVAALRAIKESRPKKSVSSDAGSTQRFKA